MGWIRSWGNGDMIGHAKTNNPDPRVAEPRNAVALFCIYMLSPQKVNKPWGNPKIIAIVNRCGMIIEEPRLLFSSSSLSLRRLRTASNSVAKTTTMATMSMSQEGVASPAPNEDAGEKRLDAGGDASASVSASRPGSDEKRRFSRIRDNQFASKIWRVVSWTPKRCRWDPDSPPKFGLALNLLFAFAGTFTVANLYYSHPILNILAAEFNVSNEKAAQVPTMAQAGYAAGLLFICPLGDILRRRAFVLTLVFFTATMYTSWRSIYWFSFGVQYLIFILLFLFMPDYPSTNPDGINYFHILRSILKMLFKHPVLVQACLVGFLASSIFTSYWTTLTFLLSSPPYSYKPLIIGLFALIGIGAVCLGPIYSRAVIDKFVPVFSVVLGLLYCLAGTIIGTYTGKFTVAGPIIQAFAIDFGLQSSQIANRSAIYAIEPKARNRVNTAYMVCVFCGQLTGTAAGNRLYAQGGWIASGSASVGMVCGALLVCFVRSPWNPGWVGWKGGWSIKRRDLGPKAEETAVEQVLEELSAEEPRPGDENAGRKK
ncbi:major facilitator superfamily transporter [Drepanopeziza brunnea f. sp. 'multigermtubi' MB_m1]|uniref:Major facilitator superfamily transporter n=1 Tax=Marssonina brunnea f. sp. multigermtubi (strain MB_m1) TaxID=1072389 RepID=K1XTF0_MARBU|nr:major facilitator superfamily transporter [Drepanopeziza brunnea f. sp. 'multigermtubi' MB_m1]EKD15814.1 major facilitator superfamily transporter [Drepanopeziza brunnea f. sp. 'multigermtubi' MB_m1]